MKRIMLGIVYISVVAWVLWIGNAQAAGLEGITFATSYYIQPVSNTSGAAVSVRLPFGTLPSPFEAVTGFKLVPQALEDRLYYSGGGTLTAQGPGAQPSPTALHFGLGYKLHESLGFSGGLSRYEFRGEVSNVSYLSFDVDGRGWKAVLEKIVGP